MIKCEEWCPFRSTKLTNEGMVVQCAYDEEGGAVRVGVLPIVNKDGKAVIDEAFLEYIQCLYA